jgi:anthranilate phosphoribosyltransferase
MAGVLAARGASALVFRGEDGLDELSVVAPSRVWVVGAGSKGGGAVRDDRVDPRDLGLAVAAAADLVGGDVATNVDVTRRFLAGGTGAVRDAVLLNAAAALVAVDGVTQEPVTEQLAAALPRAAEAVDSGAASAALESWVRASQALRGG